MKPSLFSIFRTSGLASCSSRHLSVPVTLAALSLCASSAYGASGSRTWTGVTDGDYYNGGNWSPSGDFPDGNATFSGTVPNSTITKTGNSYEYIFGLIFGNTLSTQSNFTFSPGGTRFFVGGSSISTAAVTAGSLADEIGVDVYLANAATTFGIGSNHDLKISGNVTSGGATVTKNGAGTLIFSGTNTYAASTTITAGTLQLGDGSSSGSLNPASPVSITGGTFAINQDDTVTQGTDFSGTAITGSGTFAVKGGATVVLTDPATFGDLLTVSVATNSFLNLNFTGTDTIAGLNLGAGPVAAGEWGATGSGAANQSARITGSGRLYIPGAPTWDGSTDMTWASPDSTSWSGNTYTDGDFVTFGDTGVGAVTISGTVAPGSVTVNSSLAYSFSGGAIGGSTGLVHSGSGTTTLANANTYSGITSVNAGTLQIKNNDALGTTAGNTIIATNAKLQLDGSAGNLTIAEPMTIGSGFGVVRNLSGNNTITGLVTLSAGPDLRRNSGSLTFSGGITSGVASHGVGLNLRAIVNTNPISINSGNLTVTSNGGSSDATEINVAGNTWGTTVINFGGYLKTGVANALPSTTNVEFGWSAIGFSTGTLDLNGFDQTVASIATHPISIGLGGDQNITGGGTLTVNLASGTKTYEGRITDGATATALVKDGAGTQILNNLSGTPSSYTGNTTVNGGTLALSATATLSSDSGVRINTGGILNLATGLNITVKSLVINGGAPLADGTYGSSTSGATNAGLASPDTYFAGTGILTVSSGGDYATWAIAKGIPGEPASGDYENDGISNLVEYALGTDPKVSTQPAGVYSGNTITYTKGADAIANGDVSWIIETSTTLGSGSWTPQVTQPGGDPALTILYTFTPGSPPKNFARLKVTQN